MRALCISIHDVAPQTLGACQQIADMVAKVNPVLPLTLLVVPRYHGDADLPAAYTDWIARRLERGDELALHGYTHRDEAHSVHGLRQRIARTVYTAGEGEFAALTRDEAARRIERGRHWFAERGWPLYGFVAPAWLVSPGTWDALREFDFLYTTTLARFHVLRRDVSLRAPSVVYSTRSVWRRWAARGWNRALSRVGRNATLMRVGFHPADAAHPDVMSQALELVHGFAREREVMTKSAFARRLG
ncbi:MAG TPA: polysaccharide deacetylase family protein [Burkholderiales bacterium]